MMLFLRIFVVVLLLASLAVVFGNTKAAERLDRDLLLAILAAQPPLAVCQLLLAMRFRMAIRSPGAGFKACLFANFLGQAADLVLPWRLSELVRVFYVRDQANIPIASGLSAALMERAADVVVLGALGLAAVSFAAAGPGVETFVILAAIMIGGLFVFPMIAPLLDRVISCVPFDAMRRLARALVTELVQRLQDRTFWRILAPTALIWVFAIAGFWVLLVVAQVKVGGQPFPITLDLLMALFVATCIGSAVAVLPAGVGTYEAAAVIVLAAYRVPFDQAFAIAIALHLGNILIGAIGGAAVAAFGPIRFSEILARAGRGLQ